MSSVTLEEALFTIKDNIKQFSVNESKTNPIFYYKLQEPSHCCQSRAAV